MAGHSPGYGLIRLTGDLSRRHSDVRAGGRFFRVILYGSCLAIINHCKPYQGRRPEPRVSPPPN